MLEFQSTLFCLRLVAWFGQASELIFAPVSEVAIHPSPSEG